MSRTPPSVRTVGGCRGTIRDTRPGRRLRRYKRRWIVERTLAWLHSYRRVATRREKRADLYDGFVHLACAFISLNRLVK